VDGSRGASRIDVVNASGSPRVVVDAQADLGDYVFRVLNAGGTRVDGGRIALESGAYAFDVPVAGLLRLEAVR
jgi:hypothetical protein